MPRFSSRKFLSMWGCIALFSGLLWVGKLESGDYQVLLMVILPAYFAANVVEKRATS